MGGSSSSPRVVTINQDENNVVTISEDVARRLLGRPDSLSARRSSSNEELARPVTYRSQPASTKEDEDFLEHHFQRRIRSLEKQNKVLQQTNDEAFSAAVQEFEKKFMKHKFGGPVCVELQQAVERCYNDNPGATLACIEQVKAFKACVQQHRQAMFATKE
jgi:hypothetical protein